MTALAEAKKQLAKQFGPGALMDLGSREALQIEAISTGALTLDMALGIGGVPRGRLVEIFGKESTGKTTLVYHIMANAQREGDTCAFIDAEHALEPHYAEDVGVDTDKLLISQPQYGEEGLEIAARLAETGEVGLVVVDSVDACTPRSVLEGEMGESSVSRLALLMGQACRKLSKVTSRTGTCVVFTNQLREVVNTTGFGGPTEFQPGGRALKFYASQRIDLRRIKTLKQDEEAVGNRVKARVVKNKVAAPFRVAEFDLDYGVGVSHEGCLLDLGLDMGLVKKSGSWFSYGDTQLGQGRQASKEMLADNFDLSSKLEEQVRNGEVG